MANGTMSSDLIRPGATEYNELTPLLIYAALVEDQLRCAILRDNGDRIRQPDGKLSSCKKVVDPLGISPLKYRIFTT
jgi:hypothetical protein